MSKQLCDRGQEIINSRSQWEQRQRLYYEMRHDGLRRRNKPWPSAADLHFPLIDMNIRKLKPFWESQAFGSDRLASFVSRKQQVQDLTSAAADFLDFELKQNTNFEVELSRAIDFMLLRGRGVMKVTVDPYNEHRIVCAAIDPLFILMPSNADDFDDADEWIEVRQISVAKYQRDHRYLQDELTLNAIRGSKDLDTTTEHWKDKELREGINYSRNPDEVIIWEHWKRTSGGYIYHTYSPLAPNRPLRRPMGCPYKLQGKASKPYFSFKMEIKDGGWYAPRGVAELNAPFEAYACKVWCEKTDAMTFANRPVLTSEQTIQNTAGIRWVPGEVLPGNLRGVEIKQPPYSYDQELAFTRATAEQVTMMPDFGIERPGAPGETNSKRTATENNRIASLQNVGTESNGRILRRDLAKVYQHCWGILLQFKRKELTYFVGHELKTLPEAALHDAYLIQPDGSPDQWNRQLRQQRADLRLQKFANHPNVKQDELVYDSLAADDPLIAERLYVPGNLKAASEAEDEATEILLMQDGFPAAVMPNEDHATRIFILMSWLSKQASLQVPENAVVKQRVQQHLAVHWQYLQQTQPEAARALLQQIQQQEAGPGLPGNPAGAAGPGQALPASPPPELGNPS